MNHRTDTATQGRTFNIIVQELRKRVLTILLVLALMGVGTVIGIIQPLLFKTLIDEAIPTKDGTLVAWLLVGMVVTPLFSIGLSALQGYLRAHIGEAVSQSLRKAMFDHLMHTRIAEMERIKTGEIVYRITRECGRIGELYVAQQLLPFVSNAIVFLGTFVVMFIINWQMSLLALLAFPLSFILSKRLAGYSKALDEKFSNLLEEGGSYLQEVFEGLRTVRAFNGEGYEKSRWWNWITRHWKIKAKTLVYHNVVLTLFSDFINNLVVGIVYGYGAFEIIRGRMSIGSLVAFVAYLPRVYSALRFMLNAHVGAQQAKVASEKLDDLFHLQREKSGGKALSPSKVSGATVEFHNVSFHYGRGDFGVENLSFRVQPGEFLGIVGPSGGGKTTVIDLLMGFYAPESGTITIDGVDIRELSLESLRNQIGLVSQDVFLWNASICENIVYPEDNVEPEAVEEAARIAQLHKFIEALPEGYETVVGERGLALSGGERQRLAIARAVLRQPRILLLDEATSSLDALTELKLRDAIEKAKTGRTAIVVAHRLATVIHADSILVISKGQIVEAGTPRELLAHRRLFFELYNAQSLTLPCCPHR